MEQNRISARRVAAIATAMLLALASLTLITPERAVAQSVDLPITIVDGQNSADADRLVDGEPGSSSEVSWSNAGNRWSADAYPMSATIDLGEETFVESVQVYSGQIPFPGTAALDIGLASAASPGDVSNVATLVNPAYDQLSAPLEIGAMARYVQISFATMQAHFNVSEITVQGASLIVDDPTRIVGLTATDESNSDFAARLVDETIGTDPSVSWWNPNIWQSAAYPMSAIIELDGAYDLTKVDYFVGNLNIGTDELVLEYSTQTSGENFQALGIGTGHDWNAWKSISVAVPAAQRIRLSFADQASRFNVSEVYLYGNEVAPVDDDPVDDDPVDDEPVDDEPVDDEPVDDEPVEYGDEQPRPGPPPANIERTFGFDNWPKDHLSQQCQDRHDSYWVQGPNVGSSDDPSDPENLAYHTWHPALDVLPDGNVCDYTHEHGTSPLAAGQFVHNLAGGHPPFGYAAAKAAVDQPAMMRHEDHVGHKITVATFGAAIGNGANRNGTLYDAGFECTWLSKIHQGSHSLDAFSNHLHEYYLTLVCNDGAPVPQEADAVAPNTTAFSIKVLYTYGEPDKFVEDSCSQDVPWTSYDDTIFNASELTGPEGQPVMAADRQTPLGNNEPNNRGFTCSSGVIWKNLDDVDQVDLWTELIKIEQNDGSTALTIQPYYVVKNPARIIEAYDGISKNDDPDQEWSPPSQVVRTISLCYEDDGTRLDRPFCDGAPAVEPDWRDSSSPFNGALRAVHFKSSDLRNAGGPSSWCTDAFGHAVVDPLPCEAGNIEQFAADYTNNWNNGQFSYGGQSGNVAGSIWSRTPQGAFIEAEPRPGGGFWGYRIGHELIIDNRNPDDDFDGVPDGASIGGQN